MSHETLDLVA